MNEHQKILSCWHKLEHFSPASTPKISEYGFGLLPDNEFWKIPLKSKDQNKTIEYSIFLGVFDSKHVNDFINEYFKVNEKDENFRSSKICYASLKLDKDGKYINDSFGISTLTWALGQLEKNKIKSNNWEKDFDDIKNELLEHIELTFKETIINSDGEIEKISRILNNSQLLQFQDKIEKECNWSIKPKKEIYVKRIEKFKPKNNKDSKPTSDILNSFYIKDLEKIITNYSEKSTPKAFKRYLDGSLNHHSGRIDVSKSIEKLKDTLSPRNIPDGCWPSEYTLSLMQQFAVNSIFNELENENQSGLFSVNGPPGTGKTTLLRDIIAPIIVSRAKELFKISNPSDAFKKVGQIEINENYSPWIYKPVQSISNGGIVIASSNNGAVENISKELPLKKEVSKGYQEDISYFKEVAENCINKDNWGIISAVLGNKENRNNLVSSLWFNNDCKDLQKTLKENKLFDNIEWDKIREIFKNKLSEITTEKNRLELFRKNYNDFVLTNENLNTLNQNLGLIENDYNTLKKELENQKTKVEILDKRKSEILSELSIIKSSKPNFFVYLFNSKKRNIYKQACSNALHSYNQITNEFNVENATLSEIEKKYSKLETLLLYQKEQKKVLTQKLTTLTSKVSIAQDELKKNYADIKFWDNIESQKTQESCPWYSQKLKKLNSELFIISLKLHEVFILTANATSSRISTTLAGFFEYLKGDKSVSRTEVKAMWDTFFLVIPVVSSTFASIQTMFKDLGQEDLSWLFIDEAGQAVPQAAIGSIWRSKRVGIVGDPFQIEPVVTIPNSITDNISKYFDLTNQQVNSELSVQSMADRSNPLGAYLTINSKKEWIGIPLRVHRRCISPMFEIANSIAYDNTMYNSTQNLKNVSIKFQTEFIDCKGNVEGRHFVPEQAEIIKDLLLIEINSIGNFPDVFVITPFSEVSYKLNSFLFKYLINEIKKYKEIKIEEMSDWLKSHIGTVHTFQGKQAEGVILCLGLDEKSKGAANWASQKPNLLNVAITRAKYRFIAVGDKDIWFNQPYFNQLKFLENNVRTYNNVYE
ncbi:AAA domain-containing protein [Flavobacterium sp. 316]|uniref:AAA domain-containing protein n=1 Tax=Flavobacterium sp. 316 TaxID=1603293 RepID=UPI0005FA2D5C|nr:AAA domain-containing protein [Flavobacterium sp. 316]